MIYFVSDFHLGSPNNEQSKLREKRICDWLDSIKMDADEIYFLGDIFDFWFEYKSVVPRGYVRFLGKLAELYDRGVKLHICVGNHDLWIGNYLKEECGAEIFSEPKKLELFGKTLIVHHGDGLGPGDKRYKFLKGIFTNAVAIWLFKWLHPDIGFSMASYFSRWSRRSEKPSEKAFKGNDKEYLVGYAEQRLKEEDIDYFIFGHRHLALDIMLSNGTSRYINLGEWFSGNRYVAIGEKGLEVKEFVG
jgi:UDP-2,3-diacylglucosamine hydrolase